MTSTLRLYPRGFYLSCEETDFLGQISHYQHVEVGGQYHLYVDEVAGHDVAEVDGEAFVVVVGKAWPLSTGIVPANTGSVADSLLSLYLEGEEHLAGLERIEEALYDFAGRYAIIVGAVGDLVLYNDAAGTRTVYFNEETRQVSSHYDILKALNEKPEQGFEFGNPKLEASWDATPHEDIFALMPNHRFRYAVLQQERFFLNAPNRSAELSEESKFDVVFKLWDEQVQRIIQSSSGNAFFSMTGGLDSRTSLAMARKYIKQFKSFTYTVRSALPEFSAPLKTNWEKVLGRDYRIVKKLEEFLPDDHRIIVRQLGGSGLSPDDTAVLERNCALPVGHGRWLLPGYLDITGGEIRSVHYRGNLLEIGRLYGGSTVGTDARTVALRRARVFATKQKLSSDKYVKFFLERFDEFDYGNIHEDYEINDAFYWEQRLGRWYAEVVNETDVAFDTISPFGNRRIIDIFLSFEPQVRKQAYVQKELIYRAHPVLMFFGINEDTDLYEQQKKLNND